MLKPNDKFVNASVVYDSKGHGHTMPALWDPARRRCSYDNGKTGIVSINLLAGDMAERYSGYMPAAVAAELALRDADITGTCVCDGGTCEGCYALKMTRYIDVAIKLILNTMECKQDPARFVALVETELFSEPLTAPRVVRVHDSGDFFSIPYFTAVLAMIRRHPECRFGAYTKAARIVTPFLAALADNFSLSCSPWKGHCDPIGDLPQFILDNGTDPEIAALPHCPAVDKDGRRTGIKCSQCLHCYKARRGDRWAVYFHG